MIHAASSLAPGPFALTLAFGIAIGAAAMWAALHPDRVVEIVGRAAQGVSQTAVSTAQALSGLWDDQGEVTARGPLPGPRHLTVVESNLTVVDHPAPFRNVRPVPQRQPSDPTVRLFDFERDGASRDGGSRDGGGGAAS